jgi:hypothetical protein
MAVEERRRIALHRAAAASWGEEVADTLVDLVAPSGHELATRADIEGILAAIEAMDARWEERFAAMKRETDQRFDAVDQRFAAAEQLTGDRFAAAEQVTGERFAAAEQVTGERFAAAEQLTSARFAAAEQRADERFAAFEEKLQSGLDGLEHRLTAAFERGIREAVTTQTMTLVISQLVAVVVIAGLAFGLR